jgi:hypothetical protein
MSGPKIGGCFHRPDLFAAFRAEKSANPEEDPQLANQE